MRAVQSCTRQVVRRTAFCFLLATKMGHGASTVRDESNKIFVHTEAAEGSRYLAEDMLFRDSFVYFIKSGVWISQLPKDRLFDVQSDYQVSNFLGYKSIRCACDSDRLSSKSISSLMSKRTLSSASFSSFKSSQQYSEREENLVVLDGVGCFSSEELLAVLCCVVYPLYIASGDLDDDDDLASFAGESMKNAPEDKDLSRTQLFLKTCATHFSEEQIISALSSAKWIAGPAAAFDNNHLGITISDMSLEGAPIVYANKAFASRTGYTSEHLLGKNFSLLAGPETESDQVKIVQDAMRYSRAEKVAITYFTRSRRPFVNLLSMVPAGRYSVAVHMSAAKDLTAEELKAVDDTLMLLHSLLSVRELAKPSSNAGRSCNSSSCGAAAWLPVSLACELVNHASNVLASRSCGSRSQEDNSRATDRGINIKVHHSEMERTLEMSAEYDSFRCD